MPSPEPRRRSQTWQSLPRCPNCDEDELYCVLSYETLPVLEDYLKAPVRCYRCHYQSDTPPHWMRETEHYILIRVSHALQWTELGQNKALGILPMSLRRTVARYRPMDVINVGQFRWWRFHMEFRE